MKVLESIKPGDEVFDYGGNSGKVVRVERHDEDYAGIFFRFILEDGDVIHLIAFADQ